jgi:hypothetical protein
MVSPIEPKPNLMGSAAAFSDPSDRSDALPCPIVPLAMQTLLGTANSGAGKCPLPGIGWQCDVALITWRDWPPTANVSPHVMLGFASNLS